MRTRILVVVHDEAMIDSLVTALRRVGLDPIAAADRATALALFHRTKPAAVLVGVDLGGEDGREVCAAIRERRDGSMAPILFVGSGAPTHSVRSPSEALAAGGDYFFRTPVDYDYLAGRVLAWAQPREPKAPAPPPAKPEAEATAAEVTEEGAPVPAAPADPPADECALSFEAPVFLDPAAAVSPPDEPSTVQAPALVTPVPMDSDHRDRPVEVQTSAFEAARAIELPPAIKPAPAIEAAPAIEPPPSVEPAAKIEFEEISGDEILDPFALDSPSDLEPPMKLPFEAPALRSTAKQRPSVGARDQAASLDTGEHPASAEAGSVAHGNIAALTDAIALLAQVRANRSTGRLRLEGRGPISFFEGVPSEHPGSGALDLFLAAMLRCRGRWSFEPRPRAPAGTAPVSSAGDFRERLVSVLASVVPREQIAAALVDVTFGLASQKDAATPVRPTPPSPALEVRAPPPALEVPATPPAPPPVEPPPLSSAPPAPPRVEPPPLSSTPPAPPPVSPAPVRPATPAPPIAPAPPDAKPPARPRASSPRLEPPQAGEARLRALAALVRTSDYFTILGIDPSASAAEIAEAHRRIRALIGTDDLARTPELIHVAREVIRSIDEARDVLSIPELRAAYQQHLKPA